MMVRMKVDPLLILEFIDAFEHDVLELIRHTFAPTMSLATIVAFESVDGLARIAVRLARIMHKEMNRLRYRVIEELGLIALFFDLI